MSWPDGYGKRVLAEVDSTNAEAARVAATLSGPEWILALRQTAARGRRGRTWVNPPGNFSATLAMQTTEASGVVALRSFVASLALYDAFAEIAGTEAGLALKWPNDVLMNDGKVAGILLESLGAPDRALAIGIGVNLIAAPSVEEVETQAVRPVSLLGETGLRIAPEAFLGYLARAFAVWETTFVSLGFAPVREAWLARAARIGDTVTARMGPETVVGRFVTVDEQGALVLETGAGRRAISAAEIFF